MERKWSSSPEIGSTGNGASGALFDVFLSFRGPDTRLNFANSFYHALRDKGIRVFLDNEGIDPGKEIGHEIFQAIDDSTICIPIFSTGYASSRWCLRELEHMMKRRKSHGLEVKPIFYDVEPSVVKLEPGVYREALIQHEKERGAETVQGWKEALKEVTEIAGWKAENTGHGELTRQIALEVFGKLDVSPVHLPDSLVGIDKSVDKVIDLLSVESEEIRLIGICGMGGIGKTTLAKIVYKKLSARFQSSSFIHDIRQASESSSFGLLDVQRKLVRDILGEQKIEIPSIDEGKNVIKKYFSEKEVLIILDDVNDGEQLRALAAERKWFGSGSRILVTTRNKDVLSKFQNSLIHEVEGLNSQESLELFSKHAFGSIFPPSDFLKLSRKAIARAEGLPLTIEVIGSLLRGKEEAAWKDILRKMEIYPREDVLKHLRLSYEALDVTEKEIFLDVACFLAGKNKRDATYMWDDCRLFPEQGIQVLLSRSLVKIREENELWMHDQLKDLGRSIVLAENYKNPGKRSRVWNHKDALDMITREKGTETVEAICVDFDGISLTSKEFKKLPNIRYLEMRSGNLSGDFKDVFLELRWLSWKKCPSILQATHFFPKELLILDLSGSDITEHWDGWTQLKVATRLKVIDLTNCLHLKEIPDLSAYLFLEILILERCKSLLRIDRSIGHLKRLKQLNLNGCRRLQFLPIELGALEALTEMLIDSNVFPTSISQVPSSIGALVNLERLVISGAPHLTILPDSIGMLKCLAELDVSNTGIGELPNTIINLKSLKALNMSRTCIQKLPEAIGMLEKLEEIYGVECNWLETIPSDIVRLPFLKNLMLSRTLVENVPKLPQSLVCLLLSSRASAKALDISNLVSLRNLALRFYSSTSMGRDTESPDFYPMRDCRSMAKWGTDVAKCMLQLPSISSISSYLGCLCYINELVLFNCKNLRQIGQLPSGLTELKVSNCNLLEIVDLSNLCNFRNLKGLKVLDCPKLVEIQDLDKLGSLEKLTIRRCSPWLCLPDLSNWKKLKEWDVDALTTHSARGKRVAHSKDLPLSHLKKLVGSANPEF